jgi:type VI secretion system protein ImpK
VVDASSAAPSTSNTTGSLVELSTGLIKLVAEVAENGGPAAEALRSRFNDLFIDFENRAQRQGRPAEDIRLAKYALVALIDETILLSDAPAKDDWLGRPLQLLYFEDFSAGEEFYNKLDTLRLSQQASSIEVLEVYYLAMALGFTGKLGDKKGLERRKVLMATIASDINKARNVSPRTPLSPHAEAPVGITVVRSSSPLLRIPLWAWPVMALVVVALVWGVTTLLENHAIGDVSAKIAAENISQGSAQ